MGVLVLAAAGGAGLRLTGGRYTSHAPPSTVTIDAVT